MTSQPNNIVAGSLRETPVGIIAGAGGFPFLVAEGARRQGRSVVIIGLRGLADPDLQSLADVFRWFGIGRLGGWIRFLRRHRVNQAVMAGWVRKTDMYGRFRMLSLMPDWTTARLWFFGLKDKRNDTVLGAVADVLAKKNIHLDDCVRYCTDALAPEAVLTDRAPSAEQWKDIRFGWNIAKEMGRLDIGQSVAVKETEVIAVEAIEGTDRMIERAGDLCSRGGWILIKAAKPNQDMRFDVPTVGPDTIEKLHRHGGRVLVIEAGTTVIIERERMLEMARRLQITVVGWSGRGTEADRQPEAG
ncbi:MAG: UDP-2,3-diacylglucosamine diphosphatase LpxI [Planctomycetes bacterium]|nr:UDP-2,3-diacylglucosamine diphosphatase LpxI [Planctomycetota bacterium]